MIPGWAIGVIAVILLVGTIVPGVRLWWPTHSDPIRRSDLGLALMTGALIAFAVLVVQLLFDFRAHQDDQKRQAASERETMQISVGPANLAGMGLKDARLQRFYLQDKTLNGANLDGAHLEEAVLSHSRLIRAELRGAHLRKTDLSWSKLMDAQLDGADLAKAVLYGADLDGASLEGAHLRDVVLTDARLSADLRDADLQGATLEGARLPRANLIGADLRRAWLVDADLEGAFLYGADLRRTARTLVYAALKGARWDRTTIWPKWPRGFPPESKCSHGRCVVEASSPRGTDLKRFRLQLARSLPFGWKVRPTDPTGISLVFGKKVEAEFNGEALAPSRSLLAQEPGGAVTPSACVRAYRDPKESSPRHWRTWPWESRDLSFGRLPAHTALYSYLESKRVTGIGIDVYYARDGLCYRFTGSSSPELFALFRPDFRKLFGLLGMTQLPLGRT